jgi:hypothetical protein
MDENVSTDDSTHKGERPQGRRRAREVLLGSALIPPGEYDAVGGRLRIEPKFKGVKAVVSWRVLVPDDAGRETRHGIRPVVLPQFFGLKGSVDEWTIPARGDLMDALVMVHGRTRFRLDRLPRAFHDVRARVLVADVERHHADRDHYLRSRVASGTVYSRVARIIAVDVGKRL